MENSHPYSCQLEVTLRSAEQAQQIKRVMEVDAEVGDRVAKELKMNSDGVLLVYVLFPPLS